MVGGFITFVVNSCFICGRFLSHLWLVLHLWFLLHLWVIQMSPAELLFCRKMRAKLRELREESVESKVRDRDDEMKYCVSFISL